MFPRRVCAITFAAILVTAGVGAGSAPQALAAIPQIAQGGSATPLLPSEPSAAASSVEWTGCGLAGALLSTVYLPNITKTLGGPAGWVTPFYIQNVGSAPADLIVSFYRFSDGSRVTCRAVRGISPGEVVVDNPNADADLPDNTQFAVVIQSINAPVVATVNQLQGSGPTTQALSYSGMSAGATTVFLPNVTRRFYGYDVPFIVQNMGSATTTVNASFVSFDGTQRFATTLTIDPGRSGVVDPDYTDGLIDGTQYAVTLQSTQPIGVVVNAHNEALGPVAFSHNGLGSGGTTLWAPYAMKAGPAGLFSPVVVQNLGSTTIDATLTFVPLDTGGTAQTFVLTGIGAGASRAFDPRFTLGTSTPCAAASSTCLGPGEYSLKITAATPVAAVVLPNSNSTAEAYIANANAGAWNYLPLVQRTIGGASGWTGTLYLQSATATSAKIRYHRIPDYTVDATQFVTLTPGITKRIDARTVVGLRENTEYAAIVEGSGGTIASIVFQQAGAGGDGAMIYGGFALPAPTGPFVRGTVTGPSGAVAGVAVEIGVAGLIVNSGVTDSVGQYAIAIPPGSRVDVRFGAPAGSRLADQYYAGVTSLGEATLVSVASSDVAGIDATLVDGKFITGVVTAQVGGVPVPGAKVYAHRSSCATCGTTLAGTADAGGAFRVTVPAGMYRLHIVPPSGSPYLDRWYPAGTSFSTATDVNASADVSGITGALPTGYRITGRVRDASGTALPGISARVRQGGGATCCATWAIATTDLAGQYTAVVPAGVYRVSFIPPSSSATFATAWYGGGQTFGTASDITVTGADVSGIDATLARGFAIFGSTTYNGIGSSGIFVQVYLASEPCCNNLVVQVGSDAYAQYRLSVAAGTYRVRFVTTVGGVTVSKWNVSATTFATATDVVIGTGDVMINGNLP